MIGLSGAHYQAGYVACKEREREVSTTLQNPKPTDRQEGGGHYKKLAIQPIEYIQKNELGYLEGNVIKYVTRHKDKGKAEDIRKAIHYLELILKYQYP